MNNILKFIFDFVCIFLLIFIIYNIFINKNKKDYKRLKKNDMIYYFIKRYDLNMKKTKYKDVLLIVTLINSFIISFCTVLVLNIESIIISIIVCFIVIMVLLYSLYEIIGKTLKRKEEK